MEKLTFLNILSNFILHEVVLFDDKDQRPTMVQQENKSIDPRKNAAFKNYRNNSSNIDLKCRFEISTSLPE